jgi:hypothetical protein
LVRSVSRPPADQLDALGPSTGDEFLRKLRVDRRLLHRPSIQIRHHSSLPPARASDYRIDVGTPGFVSKRGQKTAHLRAILQSISCPARPTDVLIAGPLPRGQALEFAALYERGRDEIRAWLGAAVPASV